MKQTVFKTILCHYKALSKNIKLILSVTILYQLFFLGYSTISLISNNLSFIMFMIGFCIFVVILMFHYKWIKGIKTRRAAIRTYHYMSDLVDYSLNFNNQRKTK